MKIFAILSLLVAAASAQTADDITKVLRDDFHQAAKYSGQVVLNPFAGGTYQRAALDETTSLYQNTGAATSTIVNYYVLRCIFAATNGAPNPRTGGMTTIPQWKNTTGWTTNSDFCNWYGISCTGGLVTGIELVSNDLFGTWPSEIAFLGDQIQTIDLYDNFFNFCGDYEWFKSMKVLNYLFFGTTSWDSNGIPSVLKFLDSLFELDFSFTFWRGYINPDAWTGNPDLYYLDMGNNFYTLRDLDTIPVELSSKNLLRFYFDNVKITDNKNLNLSFLPLMTVVLEFWADFTHFDGGIPSDMNNAGALKSLSLTYCQLTGTIPSSLATNGNIESLWLFANKLTGGIPGALANLKFKNLYLNQNSLTGAIPGDICAQVGNNVLEGLVADCTVCDVSAANCCTCCGPACGNLEEVTPAPTGAPTGFVVCFSGDSEVDIENMGPVKMTDLAIGDSVKVADNTFEPIYSFGHKSSEATAEYLQIATEGNRKPLELSKDHMVVVEGGRNVPASMVKRGDKLVTSGGELVAVKTIRNVVRKGAYAPFTASGSIIVNDVVASNYVAFQGAEYIQVAGVSTPFSYQWVAHTFNSVHRVAYKMGFTGESYSDSGVSQWVAAPHVAGTWLLEQNFMVALALLIPAIALFGSVSLFEAALNSPMTAATVVVGAISLSAARRSVSVKMTANKV